MARVGLVEPTFTHRRGRDLAPLIATLTADRRVGLLVTLAGAAVAGLVAGWWIPRGPTSAAAGLGVMVLGLALGVLGGLLVRTTWVAIPVAIVHVAAIEVARLDVVGPTVDAIRLDSAYGIIALVLGRGLQRQARTSRSCCT